MLRDWEKQYPGRIESMFTALQNVVPSHLMDTQRFDFKNVKATGVADAQGDKAFDPEPIAMPVTMPGTMSATSTLSGLQIVTA
jgi:tRNA 2-thiocytidine biosynthesis protein TtcA